MKGRHVRIEFLRVQYMVLAVKVASRLDRLEAEYRRLTSGEGEHPSERQANTESPSERTRQVRALIEQLDDRGAWTQAGRMRYQGADDHTTRTIESSTFCRNLVRLARFISTAQ